MGLISILGKAAVTIAKNIDKVDNISEFADLIPDKINQIKDLTSTAKELTTKASNAICQHRRKRINEGIDSTINSMNEALATITGKEYEQAIQILEEKKIPLAYSIPPQYDDMAHIGNNLFAVCLNNKWGIIDIKNQTVIPFEYDYIGDFNYDGSNDFIFPVKKNDKWGYINLKNEIILDFFYIDAWDFQQGLAPVAISSEIEDDYSYGYIDKNGCFVLPAKYDDANSFNDQNCASIGMYDESKRKIQYGVINKSGSVVVNCRYDKIIFRSEYIVGNHRINSYDFYDYTGVPINSTEEMIEKEKEEKYRSSSLQVIVCESNNDVKNRIIPYFDSKLICGYFIRTDEGNFCKIEPTFEEAYNPNKFGYARVRYNGLYGVINLNG